MICYNCHQPVDEFDARTVDQVIVVCPQCYQALKPVMDQGYFDTEMEAGMIFEHNLQEYLSVFA